MSQTSPLADQCRFNWKIAALFAIAGILWRIGFIYTGCSIINGDQAIFGIQAQHIWRGEFPLYYTGQHYLFAFESYLVALLRLFTVQITPLTIKLAATLITLLYSASLYCLTTTLLGSRRLAALAALLTMLSPAYFTQMSLVLGFLLPCLLGQTIIWLAALAAQTEDESKLRILLAALAALTGFAWFQFPMVAPFITTAFAVLLMFDLDGRRRLIRHLIGDRPLLQMIVAFPMLALFCLMLPYTWNNNLLAWRGLFQVALLCWIPLSAITLFWDEWLARKHATRIQLPVSRLLVYCTIGLSPQLIYIFFRDDIWYAGKLSLSENFNSNLYFLLFSHIPMLCGPMRHGISMHNPFPYAVNLILLIVLFAMMGLALKSAFCDKSDDPGALNRRGLLVLLIHVGFCLAFKLAATASGHSGRHLLTVYTTLFPLLALTVVEFQQFSRFAGMAAFSLLIAFYAFFNFHAREEKITPVGMWPEHINACALAMREHKLHCAYCPSYNIVYVLMFALGPDYDIAADRTHDRTPLIAQSLETRTDFAVFFNWKTRDFPRSTGLSCEQKDVGGLRMLYNFRLNGEPVTFRELNQLEHIR